MAALCLNVGGWSEASWGLPLCGLASRSYERALPTLPWEKAQIEPMAQPATSHLELL
jgi:hypothetical protein